MCMKYEKICINQNNQIVSDEQAQGVSGKKKTL